MTGKFFLPPRRQHFRKKNFRCPFQYPKVPLEAGAPPPPPPPVVNISGKIFLGALFNIQKCPLKLVPPPPQSFDASYAPVIMSLINISITKVVVFTSLQ
jgi:hypothetical protein